VSTPIVTRADFQARADEKLEEARVLLAAGRWSGANYVAGYAVELALKACIIKKLMATDAFPEKDFSRHCYSHDLKELFKLAGLKTAFDAALGASAQLRDGWDVVIEWSEAKRYERADEAEARRLVQAISDPVHGVLTWVKTYW
jgi:HEPN domain-containing protein